MYPSGNNVWKIDKKTGKVVQKYSPKAQSVTSNESTDDLIFAGGPGPDNGGVEYVLYTTEINSKLSGHFLTVHICVVSSV